MHWAILFTKVSRMKKLDIIKLSILIISTTHAFDHVPIDIFKTIVEYVADQQDYETSYDNLHALIHLMRVNKRCLVISQAHYKKLLDAQTITINKEYEHDFEQYSDLKRIFTYLDFTYSTLNNNYRATECDTQSKKIACAIQRPCLVWLHNFFKTHSESIDLPIYYNYFSNDLAHLVVARENPILPVTWAVYMNSETAQLLISGFYHDHKKLRTDTERATQTKHAFNKLDNLFSATKQKPWTLTPGQCISG